MSLKQKYSKEIRGELSLFPVWRPGDEVEPGDIGTLEKGIFEKQTSLARLFPDLAFAVKRTHLDNPFQFISKSCNTGAVAASGDVPTGSPLIKVDAALEIQFGANGGVVFMANGITQHTIDNLQDVRTCIEDRRSSWTRGYVLVSAIHNAERFTVIISNEAGVTATVRGEASVLKQLDLADASVSVSSISSNGYKTQGQGPVTMRTHGFNLLGWGSRLLSEEEVDASPQEFAEISARDPNFD